VSQRELLRKIVNTLDEAGIPYMITGALASSLQGAPRTTHDIDVVVVMGEGDAQRLAEDFNAPDYYLDVRSIMEAVRRKSAFNLVESETGLKVDFWMLTDEPFDKSRFSRRYMENLEGFDVYFSAPEDTILMKLKWANMMGGSEKQYTDALRVYELQYEVLDKEYLEDWAGRLGVIELLKRIEEESSPIS
jgi:predicted nucleotidyltransferase